MYFLAHNWVMQQRAFFTMKHVGCLESTKGECSLKTFSTQQFENKQCAVNLYKSSVLCLSKGVLLKLKIFAIKPGV